MKRVNNIYKDICNINNIMLFSDIVCKNTKNKAKVERFIEYYGENIYSIKDTLLSKKYIPGKYNIFLIHEPKLRLIMSQNVNDKIINHLVAHYFLVNVFDKSLIDNNIATRKGKGTHLGLRKLKSIINKYKNRYGNDFYYLKFDIKKFFYNIDHDVIKNILCNKIKDKDALDIIFNIIDSTDNEYINKEIINIKYNEINRINNLNICNKDILIKEVESIPLYVKGKGLPIGNMTSQILGSIMLNELDYFIKEELCIKDYIRYVDDGVLIYRDKEYLKYCMDKISDKLKEFNLSLNLSKSKICSIRDDLDFLGFRYYIIRNKVIMKARNSVKKRFKSKLFNMSKESLNSYLGHFKWGNCNGLIRICKS